jgi:hypothetical protein
MIPFVLAICAILSIFLTIKHLVDVYRWAKHKSRDDFSRLRTILVRKLDRWTFFSLFCHSFTFASNILYIFRGTGQESALPPTNVLMAFTSGFHCILLIRYLKQKESTMLIVNVITRSMVKIIAFLVGCLVIFLGYLLLGCCLFGSYASTFETWINGARSLIAVIHGDSIWMMFQDCLKRPDISNYAGFIYWTVWVFFSLTIVFNISIAIFEEALAFELERIEKKKHKAEEEERRNESYRWAFPLTYERNF